VALSVLLLPACRDTPTPNDSPVELPDPTFSAVPEKEAVPSVSVDLYRPVSAAASFPAALQAARAWQANADWYGVVPYTSMERAFAIPLQDDNPSWFFRFGTGDAEYIVEVRKGEVIGTNETKLPDYIEPPLSQLQPLSVPWDVIDSTQVLEAYLEQPDSLLAQAPQAWVDYRLAQREARGYPVWTLYNAQNVAEPIFAVHAVTGEAIPGDPP
jgi:hypothetical protein